MGQLPAEQILPAEKTLAVKQTPAVKQRPGIAIYYDSKTGVVTSIDYSARTVASVAAGALVYLDCDPEWAIKLGGRPMSELDEAVLREPTWKLKVSDNRVAIDPTAVDPTTLGEPVEELIVLTSDEWNSIANAKTREATVTAVAAKLGTALDELVIADNEPTEEVETVQVKSTSWWKWW